MNNVSFIGKLRNEPKLLRSENKVKCQFILAVRRDYKNQDNKYEFDFIPITLWDKRAETIYTYLKKGDMIGVTGKIRTSSYTDNDDKKHYTFECVPSCIQFLNTQEQDVIKVLEVGDIDLDALVEL